MSLSPVVDYGAEFSGLNTETGRIGIANMVDAPSDVH